MSDHAHPLSMSSPLDIAGTSKFAEIARLLDALCHPFRPSLHDLPGGRNGAAAQELRHQTRSIPTSALRASMHQTLKLLDTRPSVDPQPYTASRRRLGTLISQRPVEDDWIARLQARRRRLSRLSDTETRKALDADIEVRKRRRRRRIDRHRHAERIVEEHERHYQALCDWHLDHLQQLVQARWHARALLDRQERAPDEMMVSPPPYLLAELDAPPRSPEARQIWRHGVLAILRFRKDYDIQGPDHALGHSSVGATHRLRRSQVEVLTDQARQLINLPCDPVPLGEPLSAPDLGLP